MIDDSRRALLLLIGAATASLAARRLRASARDVAAAPAETTRGSYAPPHDLAARARTVLGNLRSPVLIPFLREWPRGSEQRSVSPSTVPAVRWLTQVKGDATKFCALFVQALAEAAPSLAWRRSYSSALVGDAFYDNYGWTELAGLTGPTPSARLACGVLLLGPQVFYPPHRHEAEEIYVPLVGTAEWKRGRDEWRAKPPGSVLYHASQEPHAMRTGDDPMLALYLWRSDNLAQQSQLDPPASGSTH